MDNFDTKFDDFSHSIYAFDSLPADADNFDYIKCVSEHHVELIETHKKTFKNLYKMIAVLGSCAVGKKADWLDFKDFQNSLSPNEKKLFDEELKMISRVPYGAPFIPIKNKKQDQKKPLSKDELDKRSTEKKMSEVEQNGTLWHYLVNLQNKLKERDWQIISCRLGIGLEKSETLEEVAHHFNISRERIRQIEKRELSKLEKSQFWDDLFRQKWGEIFTSWSPAIAPATLQDIDPWFDGFTLDHRAWQVFLKYFAPELDIIKKDDQLILIDKNFEKQFEDDLAFFNESYKTRKVESQLKSQLKEIHQTRDIEIDYYYELLKMCYSGKDTITVTALVREILAESEDPVSKDDIIAEGMKRGVDLTPRLRDVENALIASAVCIQSRPSLFATPKSVPFSQDDIRELCDSYYEHWLKNIPSTYYNHARNITDWLKDYPKLERIFSTDWYCVGGLRMDPLNRFKSNKLHFWLTEHEEEVDSTPALDLAIEYLRIKGTPQKFVEIKKYLLSRRAVPRHWQLNPGKHLARVGPNTWQYVE